MAIQILTKHNKQPRYSNSNQTWVCSFVSSNNFEPFYDRRHNYQENLKNLYKNKNPLAIRWVIKKTSFINYAALASNSNQIAVDYLLPRIDTMMHQVHSRANSEHLENAFISLSENSNDHAVQKFKELASGKMSGLCVLTNVMSKRHKSNNSNPNAFEVPCDMFYGAKNPRMVEHLNALWDCDGTGDHFMSTVDIRGVFYNQNPDILPLLNRILNYMAQVYSGKRAFPAPYFKMPERAATGILHKPADV